PGVGTGTCSMWIALVLPSSRTTAARMTSGIGLTGSPPDGAPPALSTILAARGSDLCAEQLPQVGVHFGQVAGLEAEQAEVSGDRVQHAQLAARGELLLGGAVRGRE